MKSKKLLFSIGLFSLLSAFVVITFINGNAERKYSPKGSVYYKEIKGAYQWLASIRNNQITGEMSLADVLNARKEISELINSKAIGMHWNELGPNNVGGRTRAILVDKDNSNLLFIGGVSGGLFKSTTGGTSWEQVPGMTEVNICCIAQSPVTGYLYVGTGEMFANVDGISGTPGFVGSGLYESIDGGVTWHIFHNATPTILNSSSQEWAFVNRIAVDPAGRIYVAGNKGLRYWDDATSTWINPVYASNNTTLLTGNSSCVVVGSDRTVAATIANVVYISPGGSGNGEPHTFARPDTTLLNNSSRVELAISPSNPNYIYSCNAASTGSLKGVYRTTDKGAHWALIGPGGAPAFNLFGDNNQGTYDNCIAVHPTNPDKIFVGGLVIWEWHYGSSFAQVTTGSELYDAHVDMHAIVFDKRNPSVFYLGSDGGIAKTSNTGQSFITINKNYNVTQFYAVACNGTTGVMGGTQDNSNPYVSGTGVDPKKGSVLFYGDGGWAAFSLINTSAFFGTMQNANIWRSPDKGVTYQSADAGLFMSPTMKGSSVPGTDAGPFVTALTIWESFNNYYSHDMTWYVDTLNHIVGDNIIVKSQNDHYPFNYIITPEDGNLAAGDTLAVQDIISSHFFVGTASGIWFTRQAIQFGPIPQWFNIANISNAHTMTISKDGNYLFVGTIGGALYRISNILAVSDSVSAWYNSPYCVVERSLIKTFSNQAVTSIAIDPNNPERIVVTLGNYGNSTYVYYCNNALDQTPTFTAVQGTANNKKLPAMPVYSAIFEMNHPNMVIIGTEYGIFATQDITKNAALIEWTEENTGMARVPVFMIRQQIYDYPGVTNFGAIYIGTHGKGFYENTEYLGINDNPNTSLSIAANMNIYPNPAVDNVNIAYSLLTKSAVTIKIYDINGRLVKLLNLLNVPTGNHIENINCSSFSRGTYFVQLITGNNSRTAKFVVTK